MKFDAITASVHAQTIYESGLLVHWMASTGDEHTKEYHVNLMHESFAKLADAMGYDIKKREE